MTQFTGNEKIIAGKLVDLKTSILYYDISIIMKKTITSNKCIFRYAGPLGNIMKYEVGHL
jgi:hypothetical protein